MKPVAMTSAGAANRMQLYDWLATISLAPKRPANRRRPVTASGSDSRRLTALSSFARRVASTRPAGPASTSPGFELEHRKSIRSHLGQLALTGMSCRLPRFEGVGFAHAVHRGCFRLRDFIRRGLEPTLARALRTAL